MRPWTLLATLLLGCRENLTPDLPPEPTAPGAWSRLLAASVDEHGYVRYDRIEENRSVLDTYVAWVANPAALREVGTPKAHAFWINVFNALTIHQVLARDLPGSVRDVPGWLPWPGAGFFLLTEYRVDANPHLSLWEIAHERVLHANQDYRMLAALCFGARSAPPSKPGIYTPNDLGGQLAGRFRAWVMDGERLVRFEGDRVRFNPVLDGYRDEIDLWTHGTDLCTLVARHATGDKRERLVAAAERGCPHDFFAMDWRLNDHFRSKGWRGYQERAEAAE